MRELLAKNKYLKAIYKLATGHQPLYLEYPIDLSPRWGGQTGNKFVSAVISDAKSVYERNLSDLIDFENIVSESIEDKTNTFIDWHNGFIPAIDALTIMWAATRAESVYLEVGSGNSTMFAYSALRQFSTRANIISIDPAPRADVDRLCDELIRMPLEDVEHSIFDRLNPGDTLFIDNSHRSFMNSDVTVFMLEILPRLKSGVLVGIHDIFLPFDYLPHWSERAYNEQYLLGCYLLANENYFDIQFANYWICKNELHKQPLRSIWDILGDEIRDRKGSAFWGIKR